MNLHAPVYPFDVLPAHPAPEPLESFTSYLMRLAGANGITRYSDLAYRLFPGWRSNQVRSLSDHVPPAFGRLAAEAQCPDTMLLATTFYHLGRKFGRGTQASALSSFVSGAVAMSLRYCPACLDEQAYYPLPWRFLDLAGCPQHRCRLLDRCGGCGRVIPLFPVSLRVGLCPHCRIELKACPTEGLLPEEHARAADLYHDLAHLLTPAPWETGGREAAAAAGHELERLRWKTGLTARGIFHQCGLPAASVGRMERGHARSVSPVFQSYLRYAAFLGVSLWQVFLDGLAHYDPLPGDLTYEMKLVTLLQHGIARIQAAGQFVCDATLRETTGLSRKTFWSCPATRALLEQRRAAESFEHETDLLARIRDVVASLQAEGQPVHRVDICRALRMGQKSLQAYPRIRDYLRNDLHFPPNRPKAVRTQQHEQQLLARVEQAIQDLLASGQPVTQPAIAQHVGLCVEHLRRFPQVKQALKQTRTIRREQGQAHLLERVHGAIAQLEAEGRPVTRSAVTELTGLVYSMLSKYPRIDALLAQHRQARQHQQQDGRKASVREAIDQLQETGQPITQAAICEVAELGPSAPCHHADIRVLIQPVLAAEPQRRARQVVEQVSRAVASLRSCRQRVSLPAVSALMGLSVSALRRYPEVVPLVREARAVARQQDEDELIQRIDGAIQQLRAADRPLTQKNICAVIGWRAARLADHDRAKAAVDRVASQFHRDHSTPWHERYGRRA